MAGREEVQALDVQAVAIEKAELRLQRQRDRERLPLDRIAVDGDLAVEFGGADEFETGHLNQRQRFGVF